ncbi:hypothetical protein D9M70_513480 [compost metagenome]
MRNEIDFILTVQRTEKTDKTASDQLIILYLPPLYIFFQRRIGPLTSQGNTAVYFLLMQYLRCLQQIKRTFPPDEVGEVEEIDSALISTPFYTTDKILGTVWNDPESLPLNKPIHLTPKQG